jgi:hypothetical protein
LRSAVAGQGSALCPPLLSRARLQLVFGTGQVGTALAAHHLHAISTADALAVHVPVLE